jgi:hypothetical protein
VNARSLKTARQDFMALSTEGHKLFSVNPGAPVDDALEFASCLLASALDLLGEAADTSTGWTARHLVETAKAVIDSSATSILSQPKCAPKDTTSNP